MSLFENKYVQILLAVLAFYVLTQIMASKSTKENMDTVVTVPQSTGQVTIESPPTASISITNLPGQEKLVTVTPTPTMMPPQAPLPMPNGTISGMPVMTSGPAASGPQPLTSVEETLHAAAPNAEQLAAVGAQLGLGGQDYTSQEYNSMPSDYSDLFSQRNQLEPSDLIPKIQEEDLYGNLKPNPKLDQNFLTNAFSGGISVEETTRNTILDIRGLPPSGPNPRMIVSPFLQPSQFPSSLRKSLADVC